MANYIFKLEHEDHALAMYRDDEGMYRVILVRTGADGETEEVLLAMLEDRQDATYMFNTKVHKMTFDWERTIDS